MKADLKELDIQKVEQIEESQKFQFRNQIINNAINQSDKSIRGGKAEADLEAQIGHVELYVLRGYPCGDSQQATVSLVWNSKEGLQ